MGADFVDNYFGDVLNALGKRFLLDTITNVVGSVTNTVNNVVTTAQNTISAAQLVGQILWDNAFGPSLDLFLNCIYHFKKDN